MSFPIQAFAADITIEEFKSLKAREAIGSYQKELRNASREYQTSVRHSQQKLIENLNQALRIETKKANLEEAVKIQSAIKAYDDASVKPSLATTLDSKLTGKWTIKYAKDNAFYITFYKKSAKLFAKRSKSASFSKADDGLVEIRQGKAYFEHWDGKSMERYTLDGNRLFVENWMIANNKSLERFPDFIGIAEPIAE